MLTIPCTRGQMQAYKLFSNRAACYTKLGAWNEGVKVWRDDVDLTMWEG